MADIAKFIEDIKALTVLELNELVKAIEEEFGVSAAAPVMMAGAAAGGEAAAEKTEFDVILTEVGSGKMNVIKAVKEGVSKADAEDMKTKLEGAGATVELK